MQAAISKVWGRQRSGENRVGWHEIILNGRLPIFHVWKISPKRALKIIPLTCSHRFSGSVTCVVFSQHLSVTMSTGTLMSSTAINRPDGRTSFHTFLYPRSNLHYFTVFPNGEKTLTPNKLVRFQTKASITHMCDQPMCRSHGGSQKVLLLLSNTN